MNEKSLIKQCCKNNRTAQKELFEMYKDTLYCTSLKYCRNDADAEDNLHDAFITIFEKIKTFKNKGSFEGWMKRITIFKAIDKYKNRKEISVKINEEILVATEDYNEELNICLNDLLKIIQQLPDQYRLVFNIFQLDGFSHKEVAKMLSISESTSKSNYHRAKALLRDKITSYNAEK